MAHSPSIIRDIFDFRIFRYWLLSLAICIGFFFLLVVLGILGFVYLFDPFSILNYALSPDETSSLLGKVLYYTVNVIVGTFFSIAIVFGSWVSYSIILLTVLSFFNESIIRVIRDKHYHEVPLIDGFSFFPLLIEQCKVIAFYAILLVMIMIIMIALFLILSWPMIPVVMIWSFFSYRSLLLTDCGVSIYKPKELLQERGITNTAYWQPTAITFIGTLIPGVNLLAPLVAIVWTSHIMLKRKQKSLLTAQ